MLHCSLQTEKQQQQQHNNEPLAKRLAARIISMNHITPVTTTVRTLYNIILSSITENIFHFN
jgi:UDP-N-acetylglucosamine:LPS N-acetylglucosamine transferase